VDGAVEFTRELSQIADVVILTSRLSQDDKKATSAEFRKTVTRIEDLSCKPMVEGIAAFKDALEQTERLCN